MTHRKKNNNEPTCSNLKILKPVFKKLVKSLRDKQIGSSMLRFHLEPNTTTKINDRIFTVLRLNSCDFSMFIFLSAGLVRVVSNSQHCIETTQNETLDCAAAAKS